jgi:hypothetical protein
MPAPQLVRPNLQLPKKSHSGPVGTGDGELIAVPQFVLTGVTPPASWTFNSDELAGDATASADQAQSSELALARTRADVEGAVSKG